MNKNNNDKRGLIVAFTIWLIGMLYFFIQKSKG